MIDGIVLIGAGNVGYHLGRELHRQGQPLRQVFSRSRGKARQLGEETGTPYTCTLDEIMPEAEVYLLAVNDDAIARVAEQLAAVISPKKLVVHTSGATPDAVLAAHFPRHGVFYPLQSFTRSRPAEWIDLPICISAATPADLALLDQLGRRLSNQVFPIDDEQRARLHLAAVFVNNFSNHLFHIGEDLLLERSLPFDLLRPLIRETAAKVQQCPPREMQTGPAARGDVRTMQQHLEQLRDHPGYREIYRLLSDSIRKR